MDEVEFIQYVNDENLTFSIKNPRIDGECLGLLREHMLEDPNTNENNINHIYSNGYKILQYLIDPSIEIKKCNKILCLGKVQSGKTAFFISSIALAFDNGYNLAYVIGGTKTKLKDQNFERLIFEFSNNERVKIIDIANNNHEDPILLINEGYKVILVALKNPSENTNLGLVEDFSLKLKDIPSIIIDDEGDECSPGAPKLKAKHQRAGITHDYLSTIINNINICTFLSVTATPQANFLLSTIDELSPDYCVLVEPGYGYTGGNAFHDTYDNPHVVEISDDAELFNSSIPESFKHALYFFIFSLLTHNFRNDNRKYSMLVHPSSLTKVQSMVVEKIHDFYDYLNRTLHNPYSLAYDEIYEKIFNSGKNTVNDFENVNDFKSKTETFLLYVLSQISIYEFNVSINGRQSIKTEKDDESMYKIYVGGNMLGRGLTIKNLCVTYMYRDSKITQIDTLYQRARWFGYKKDYFDLCRVYMTKDLKQKFINTVENENDMWTSISAFLLTKLDIKNFPRIFTLNNDKLKLTRTSVSKTITVERVNPGYEYDKSIALTIEQKHKNKELYYDFFEKYKNVGLNKQFGSSDVQQHFIIDMKYSEFYSEFITKYEFPRGSKLGYRSFERILNQIKEKQYEDKITVVIMRYRTGEQRTSISNGCAIKELPQSYDNGTNYPGDKHLPELEKKFHIQIHLVYTDKNNSNDIIPIIAMNNPITAYNVKYVTGDNDYERI